MDGLSPPMATGWQAQKSTSVVLFFRDKVVDPKQSEKSGRPIHVNADFVRVMHPGERDQQVLLVTEEHKRRWPTQWAQYQQNQEQLPEGTSLELLFPNDPAIVENLKGLKFHTVEQLASAPDIALQNIGMGSREWQMKARKFLEVANGSAGFHKLQAELDAVKAERDTLKDAVARLEARMTSVESGHQNNSPRWADGNAHWLTKDERSEVRESKLPSDQWQPPKRKRGRPRKDAAA